MVYSEGDLQRKHIDLLVRNRGFEFTDTFLEYTSGKIGPDYVHTDYVQRSGTDLALVCDDIARMIQSSGAITNSTNTIISGGELRDLIFSPVVATKLVLPHVVLRKDRRTNGAYIKGREVIHVADINNEGYSLEHHWFPMIKSAGGNMRHACFYVDRMEGGAEVVKKLGLNSMALIKMDTEAWDYMLKQGMVERKDYMEIMKRRENRDKWAIEMLRSDRGLAKLASLSQEKIEHILNFGYPEIREEIEDRLKKLREQK